MKLVWCPDTASKSYIAAVRSLSKHSNLDDASVAELVAAMAGGWKAEFVVEAYARGDSPATSIALAAALKHTQGRRWLVPTDHADASNYAENSEAQETAETRSNEYYNNVPAQGVDFMVVDMRRRDAGRLVREARAGPRGMVVICKNVMVKSSCGSVRLGKGMRLVRSAYLPIGRGVEILHVGVGKGPGFGGGGGKGTTGCSRWFKHVDRVTGEEHLFRK